MSHTRTLNYKKYNSAFLHMGPHDDLPDAQRKRTTQDPAIRGFGLADLQDSSRLDHAWILCGEYVKWLPSPNALDQNPGVTFELP